MKSSSLIIQNLQINSIVFTDVPVVQTLKTRYDVKLGETVTLLCNISSDTQLTKVYWEREKYGSQMIIPVSPPKYGGSSVSSPSLIVHLADYNDEGKYTCHATNQAGNTQSTPVLLIIHRGIP